MRVSRKKQNDTEDILIHIIPNQIKYIRNTTDDATLFNTIKTETKTYIHSLTSVHPVPLTFPSPWAPVRHIQLYPGISSSHLNAVSTHTSPDNRHSFTSKINNSNKHVYHIHNMHHVLWHYVMHILIARDCQSKTPLYLLE